MRLQDTWIYGLWMISTFSKNGKSTFEMGNRGREDVLSYLGEFLKRIHEIELVLLWIAMVKMAHPLR